MITGGECQECFSIVLYGCRDSFSVSTGYTSASAIFWKLESYKRAYFGSSVPDITGVIVLEHDDFSPALFIEAEGVFTFTILSIDEEPTEPQCEPIMIEFCEVLYPCLAISFKQ